MFVLNKIVLLLRLVLHFHKVHQLCVTVLQKFICAAHVFLPWELQEVRTGKLKRQTFFITLRKLQKLKRQVQECGLLPVIFQNHSLISSFPKLPSNHVVLPIPCCSDLDLDWNQEMSGNASSSSNISVASQTSTQRDLKNQLFVLTVTAMVNVSLSRHSHLCLTTFCNSTLWQAHECGHIRAKGSARNPVLQVW